MSNRLKEAIQEEFSLREEVAIHITKYAIDEYELEDITAEDIEHILNNLYVYNSETQAILSITESMPAYNAIKNMNNFIIKSKDVNKSFIHVWLERYGYQKVDIENSDIWFTIY